MNDLFNLNNRRKVPNISKTLRKMSNALEDKIMFLDTPLIMRSSGTPCQPELKMEAPYFQGQNVRFHDKFTNALVSKKDFVFYIIANSFKQTFSSHALIGFWDADKEVLTFFDPNGDFYVQDTNSVYNGYGFFIAPQKGQIKNPLYNTLVGYFDLPKMRVYTGNPIMCPRNEHTCAFRSFMYVLGLVKTRNHNKAVRYTSRLAKQHIHTVRGFIQLFDFAFGDINVKAERNKLLADIYENLNFGNVSTKSI